MRRLISLVLAALLLLCVGGCARISQTLGVGSGEVSAGSAPPSAGSAAVIGGQTAEETPPSQEPGPAENWTPEENTGSAEPEARILPVLMYHYVQEEIRDDFDVTPERFREQMEALLAAGYETVTLAQVIAFAEGVGSLPEKPVLITFDDGYVSVYTQAFPILRELGMTAVSFLIGWSVGLDTYKDTGISMSDHLDWDEAREMLASGVFEFQSHTWDMHRWAPYETELPVRENVLPLEGEDMESYAAALRQDWKDMEASLRAELGVSLTALAYPGGFACDEAETILREQGCRATFTTREGTNLLTAGQPEGLFLLNRCNVPDSSTGEELVERLERLAENP